MLEIVNRKLYLPFPNVTSHFHLVIINYIKRKYLNEFKCIL